MSVNEHSFTAGNVPGIQDKLKNARVAIAGLGGLGSNIAVMLARIGVGNLFLVDFDKVEPSNLNRQHYNTSHLGMYKTDALKCQLDVINPYAVTETATVKVTEDNISALFGGYPVVCEAFDDPLCKAVLVNSLLEIGTVKIVAASGMNGTGSANEITTKRVFKNLYLCGDSEPPPQNGIGFMAPRVTVCAGHQANMVLRLILGIEEA
jgi:sulfur carrier protein ThiS adenylyltransferase